MSASDERILAAVPGLTEQTLRIARQAWHQEHDMRRILIAIGRMKIEEHRTTMETADPDQIPRLQGQIAGTRAMVAVIETQGQL